MSTYIKLSTLDYPRHIGDIELDPAGIEDYALVEWVDPPIFNIDYQYCSQSQPVKKSGKWYVNWEIKNISLDEMSTKIRNKRNQLLSMTDWTQVADAPVDRETWATYRQALRNVPIQKGFPWSIDWPVYPTPQE